MKKAIPPVLFASIVVGVWFYGTRPDAPIAPPTPRSATFSTLNAENPDATYVDFAKRPFDPALVGGTFRLALAPPRSLHPIVRESEEAARVVKYFLTTPLLMEAPDRKDGVAYVVPYGAETQPVVSEDGKTWTWTLRLGPTWEDGRPLVAEDYVFAFRLMRAEGVGAVDDRVLRVTSRRGEARAATTFGLDFFAVPSHKETTDAATTNAAEATLSSGPYRVAKKTPESLELRLRDDYRATPYPPRPHYAEAFTWTHVADPVQRYARFVGGEFDLAQLDFDRFLRAGDDPAFKAKGWRAPLRVPSFSAVFWNTRDPSDPERKRPHPLLGDARVRRALDRLFDREGLARHVFHGAAEPTSGPFAPNSSDADPGSPPRPFDPDRARAELEAAGFKPGADGILVRDGVRCALTLVHPRLSATVFTAVPPQFQEAARRAGVDVAIDARDFASTLKAGADRSADAVLILWFTSAVEPDVADTFRSDGAVAGGNNWSAYADATLDAVFDRLAVERDPLERSRLRRAVHKRLHEEAPVSFLFVGASPVVVSRRFANVFVHDLGLRYWDFVERARFDAQGGPR
jgi:peptide/nickel transport system substrate-binding protein